MKKDYFRSSSGSAQFLWLPDKNWVERNVWFKFQERFDAVRKAKEETNKKIGLNFREASDFSELTEGDKNILILTQSSTDLSNIPKNQIDYVITDPPYSDQVVYLEYTLLYKPWFNYELDFENEIVITDSPARKDKFHNVQNYQTLSTKAFGEISRVLKPDRWMSIWFRCKDPEIWKALTDAIDAGFERKNVVQQPFNVMTWNRGINPNGTLDEYIIINARKTEKKTLVKIMPSSRRVEQQFIEIATKEIIRGAGTDESRIWSSFISKFLTEYGIPPPKLDYRGILNANFKIEPETGIWRLKPYKIEDDPTKLVHYTKQKELE